MSTLAELIKNGLKKISGKKNDEPQQIIKETEGEYFDLYPMVCYLADLLGEACIKKKLELVFDLAWGTPKQLYGNPDGLQHMLSELFTRAVENADKGKVVFGIGFDKTEDDSEHAILNFSIMISGDGIEEGTLAELRQLCEKIGSSLNTETVPGLGAKYSFDMKMGVAAWEPLGSFEKAYNEELRKRISIRERFTCPDAEILIVDDSAMNLEVLKSLLEHTGVKIDTAESGDKGIALSADNEYDIIFLDHMMPDKDGIETLRELREAEKNKKAVMICLTANAISGARKWYLSEGFDDYLAKPVSSEKLEDILLKYLPAEKIIKGAFVENG